MSAFNNNGTTLKGAVIIASLVAGETLTFSRIVVGDGVLPAGQTVLMTEELVNPLFNVPISSVESDSVAHATIKGVFNNRDLNTGFYYRELGLYAINPVTGAEELFCYGNAGDEAEWINPAGQSSLIEKEIHLVTLIGNATSVTALFDEKAPVLKSEFDKVMPLKADLDDTPENGGRVLASQMRFEQSQIMYVDAAASSGGDGSESKPFKTIAEAVAARYRGTNNIVIYIKPGNYPENVKVEAASGSSWYFGRWGDTGAVTLRTMEVRNCNFLEVNTLNFAAPNADFVLALSRNAGFTISDCTFDGGTTYAVLIGSSVGLIQNSTINNSPNAIYAWGGAQISLGNVRGTGNTSGFVADNSVIFEFDSPIGAQNRYVRVNGGAINTASGDMTFTSNYSQLKYLGDITSIDALRAALLAEFRSLQGSESRFCQFANNIPGGFGILDPGQMIQARITKGSVDNGGYGTILLQTAFSAPLAFMQIQRGAFANNLPIAFAEDLPATPATYGLMRVAAVEDEQNCQCEDAAITPANLYDLNNYRKASTAYKVGDVVACPYHAEFMLKCTQAGTTSKGSLDTTSATLGKVYTDGGVKWEVIVLPIELGGTGANTAQDVRENLNVRLQTFTSLAQLGLADTATPVEIARALPENSELNFYARTAIYTNMSFPIGGSCRVEKRSTASYSTVNFFVYAQTTPVFYYGVYSSYNNIGFSGWKKVMTENNFPAIDFASKVTLSEETDNVMASDGYVYFRLEQHSSYEMSFVNFTLNGVQMPGIQANDYSTDSVCFPVRKGDVLKIFWGNQSTEQHTFNFYKLRGV